MTKICVQTSPVISELSYSYTKRSRLHVVHRSVPTPIACSIRIVQHISYHPRLGGITSMCVCVLGVWVLFLCIKCCSRLILHECLQTWADGCNLNCMFVCVCTHLYGYVGVSVCVCVIFLHEYLNVYFIVYFFLLLPFPTLAVGIHVSGIWYSYCLLVIIFYCLLQVQSNIITYM